MDAETIAPTLESYRQQRAHWRSLVKELEEKTSKRRELAMRADQLSFAIEEIDAVSPEPDEDQDLASQIRRMQDLDGLRDAAAVALAAIDGAAAVSVTGMDAATEDSGACLLYTSDAADE